MKDTLKIFIGNVDDRTSEEEVTALFEQFGPVASCAVMKQYAFVHMRGAEHAQAAIDALNGRELHGKRIVVELSKPRPQNTWKIFIGNVSPSCDVNELRSMFEVYGEVVECDVVKDYAFVHMKKESDAKNAIENLNGTEVNGKRINVEMSNKASRPMGANGRGRAGRPQEFRDMAQTRPDPFSRRKTAEEPYSSFPFRSPFDRYMGDTAQYESRMRSTSPLYYSRDRSPLRRSPTRSAYGLTPSATALASKYRTPVSGYGSLSSAYGDQTSAGLSSQTSAYGSRAGAFGSTYGTQGGYDSQASAYGTETQAAYGTDSSSAYGLQSAYGSQLSSMAASYSSQASSNPYAAHTASNPYASSSALANAYRAQQTSAYDTPQASSLGMQSSYSSLSSADTPMYERTRLSPPIASSTDVFKSRLSTDRRYSDLADYRRLTQESQDSLRRSPPRSQMDYRRMPESSSDYYGDYMRAAQMAAYQRRL